MDRPEPMLFGNGDLLIPVRLDNGQWGTEVIHPHENEYAAYVMLYQKHQKDAGALGTWGWAGALLLPPVGVLIGIILLAKGKNGTAILITSIIIWIAATALVYYSSAP